MLLSTNRSTNQNGLFSAVVAALVVLSIADLRPDMQEKSAFFLERMYLKQLNALNSTTPEQYVFHPPKYSILANSLWFLSLVISLTCAMLATSVQQWARRYITITQPARCSPKQRARMRAFLRMASINFTCLGRWKRCPPLSIFPSSSSSPGFSFFSVTSIAPSSSSSLPGSGFWRSYTERLH
jgi:hypothetical protein